MRVGLNTGEAVVGKVEDDAAAGVRAAHHPCATTIV
jgi:hypothetical protein